MGGLQYDPSATPKRQTGGVQLHFHLYICPVLELMSLAEYKKLKRTAALLARNTHIHQFCLLCKSISVLESFKHIQSCSMKYSYKECRFGDNVLDPPRLSVVQFFFHDEKK